MKRRNKQLLVENEYVKELLAVLKENPSPSGKDFAEMVAHVGELESRLAEAVEELKTMRQELQQVQSRALVGKEPVAEVKSPGRLSKVIAAPYKADRACMTAAQKSIEKAIDSVTRLQESAERRPSVLRAMQENGEKVQPPAKKAVPAVSKAER